MSEELEKANGLPLHLLQELTKRNLKSLECSICQEIMVNPFVLHPCGHSFCHGCLYEWFNKKLACPMCRSAVRREPILNQSLKDMINNIIDMLVFNDSAMDKVLRDHIDDKDHQFLKTLKSGKKQFGEFFENIGEAIVDSADGVPRCSNCHWEVHGSVCLNCGRHIVNAGGDGESDSLFSDDYESAEVDEYDEDDDFIDNSEQISGIRQRSRSGNNRLDPRPSQLNSVDVDGSYESDASYGELDAERDDTSDNDRFDYHDDDYEDHTENHINFTDSDSDGDFYRNIDLGSRSIEELLDVIRGSEFEYSSGSECPDSDTFPEISDDEESENNATVPSTNASTNRAESIRLPAFGLDSEEESDTVDDSGNGVSRNVSVATPPQNRVIITRRQGSRSNDNNHNTLPNRPSGAEQQSGTQLPIPHSGRRRFNGMGNRLGSTLSGVTGFENRARQRRLQRFNESHRPNAANIRNRNPHHHNNTPSIPLSELFSTSISDIIGGRDSRRQRATHNSGPHNENSEFIHPDDEDEGISPPRYRSARRRNQLIVSSGDDGEDEIVAAEVAEPQGVGASGPASIVARSNRAISTEDRMSGGGMRNRNRNRYRNRNRNRNRRTE
ncbi:hypothetical protein CANARDRAFT_22198 [[Candida] arabinofermentans NRRL YB-2248]|uniref:RING-type domain-containing protein n=1 Tax=[Candida] arabinofermentans NRRL YB-2248 TaxID=983967 RepID=A0A1E4T3I0_9ASCO|nr:hypothetical protein CANARDRAFT_22198 [[Candida] arabinofermentans NRRL YB-2248]